MRVSLYDDDVWQQFQRIAVYAPELPQIVWGRLLELGDGSATWLLIAIAIGLVVMLQASRRPRHCCEKLCQSQRVQIR